MNKLSIITGFLGATKNRYMTYQEDRPLEEKFAMAKRVDKIEGLEICYPQDFSNFEELCALLKKYEFGVAAINFRSRRTGQWLRGSFTSEIDKERKDLVEDFKKCIDYARVLGCDKITTCPLNEGHDYIFEMNYENAYTYFEETMREIANYAKDIKICIEYKWNDPRGRCLLGNAGETLAFCKRVGCDNVGVTLDIGHAIQAGERPSQSAVMLARENRLFYVHLNDNDKLWDWDMIPGAYNFWDFIEFIYYLRKLGYNDWISYDVFPKEIDTVENFNVVTNTTSKLFEIAGRLNSEKIEALLLERNPAKSMSYLYSIL